MKRLAILLVLSVALSGCATRPVPNESAVPVPIERVLDATFLTPVADVGVVTVKRDRGIGGSACSSRVYVNAKPVADIDPSEKVVLYLAAGDYIIGAWPNGLCGGGLSEVRANVKPDVPLTFRIGYGSNGDFSIQPTSF